MVRCCRRENGQSLIHVLLACGFNWELWWVSGMGYKSSDISWSLDVVDCISLVMCLCLKQQHIYGMKIGKFCCAMLMIWILYYATNASYWITPKFENFLSMVREQGSRYMSPNYCFRFSLAGIHLFIGWHISLVKFHYRYGYNPAQWWYDDDGNEEEAEGMYTVMGEVFGFWSLWQVALNL